MKKETKKRRIVCFIKKHKSFIITNLMMLFFIITIIGYVSYDKQITKQEVVIEVKKEALESRQVTALAVSNMDQNKYATVAEVQAIMLSIYPVGSIYISTNNTNPSNYMGGIWESYAAGRTLIGVGTSDQAFLAGNAGGSSNITLKTENLPTHSHTIPSLSGTTNTAGDHSHPISQVLGWPENATAQGRNTYSGWGVTDWPRMTGITSTANAGSHLHTVITNASATGDTGTASVINNLSPYITVYIWKRTS